MKLQTILDLPECKVLVKGNPDREISKVFCCDLLSIAMGKAPADCVWVTVMGNKNTLAVATLADAACIVLAEGIGMDEGTLEKAAEEGNFLSSILLSRSMRLADHDPALL